MSEAKVTPEWGVEHFDPWDKRITYSNVWGIYQGFGRECLPFQGEGESFTLLDAAGFPHTHE